MTGATNETGFERTECTIEREDVIIMSKIKVVHYINQFFAHIGGEEKADYPAELRVGEIVGPGHALDSEVWR